MHVPRQTDTILIYCLRDKKKRKAHKTYVGDHDPNNYIRSPLCIPRASLTNHLETPTPRLILASSEPLYRAAGVIDCLWPHGMVLKEVDPEYRCREKCGRKGLGRVGSDRKDVQKIGFDQRDLGKSGLEGCCYRRTGWAL